MKAIRIASELPLVQQKDRYHHFEAKVYESYQYCLRAALLR
jgi:hypothetical protein